MSGFLDKEKADPEEIDRLKNALEEMAQGVSNEDFPIQPQNSPLFNRPKSDELVLLLQKQDSVIAELFSELGVCREEVAILKRRSLDSAQENKRLFSDLRSQISEANRRRIPTVDVSDAAAKAELFSDDAKVQSQPHLDLDTGAIGKDYSEECSKKQRERLARAREREVLATRKIQEALALADQAKCARDLLAAQCEHQREKLEESEKLVEKMRDESEKELREARENALDQYRTEFQAAKTQAERLKAENAGLVLQIETLTGHLNDSKRHRNELTDAHREREAQLRNEVAEWRSESDKWRLEQSTTEGALGELRERHANHKTLHEQQVEALEGTVGELKEGAAEARRQLVDRDRSWVHVNQQNTQLHHQLCASKTEVATLKSELEQLMQRSVKEIQQLKTGAAEREEWSRFKSRPVNQTESGRHRRNDLQSEERKKAVI